MIQNFSMIAGDTRTLVVTVKDPDGDAVSITSATIKWHAARTSSRTAAITKTTGGSGIAITDGAGGIFTVTLDADDTEDLVGNFMHEAEITFADSSISTVLQGTMKINPRLIANAT